MASLTSKNNIIDHIRPYWSPGEQMFLCPKLEELKLIHAKKKYYSQCTIQYTPLSHRAVFLPVKQQSGVCFVSLLFVSWTQRCHQTSAPTAALNESLRSGQLCSGQETTPFKNYHLKPAARPIPSQTSQHCNLRRALHHLPHRAAASLPPSIHPSALNCEPEQPATRSASSHLKTSSAFKLKLTLVTHSYSWGSGCFIKRICMQESL